VCGKFMLFIFASNCYLLCLVSPVEAAVHEGITDLKALGGNRRESQIIRGLAVPTPVRK
jgi:hypothetical protein